jgi:putative endonuclease
MDQKKKTHDRGLMAEGVAELFLRAKGFQILERRYKTSHGEIDLIALDDQYLVFIEVKVRSTIEDALFCITPKMRGCIGDSVMYFLACNGRYEQYPMRFDVMAVRLPFTIHHMENAWNFGE